MPRLSAATSGVPSASFFTPPCILSARTVATTIAASGLSPPKRHLMSKNFSAPEVGAEAGLGEDDVAERRGRAGSRRCELQPCAMLPNGPAVHQRRAALERLHQVGQDRVLEQQRHGAGRLELARGDRLPVAGEAHDDPADAGLEVLQVGGQGTGSP